LRTLERILSRAEEILCATLLAEAAILTFVQVALRYLFGVTHSWMVELINYSFIYSALIGASIGVREKVHIGVDIVIKKLPPRVGRWVSAAALGLAMLFTIAITIIGLEYVNDVRVSGQVSPDLEVPKWIPYTAIPAGFALMSLRFLQELYLVVTGKADALAAHGPADTDIPVQLIAKGGAK